MIADFFLNKIRRDSLIKRDFLKAITWRILGSLDTFILGYLISGKLIIGVKVGLAEILTKIVLYFLHERLWHTIKFGLPSRKTKALTTKNNLHLQLFQQITNINKSDRELLNNHKAFTVWLTGLSASGKSSVANALDSYFFNNKIHAFVIDGDNTRLGINSDLSFSNEDRSENIRRVAELCKLFNDAGTIAIAAFISPFEFDRHRAQHLIGKQNFIEIYLSANIETCASRDKKGLYKLAALGKIKDFTGISSPYEIPTNPTLTINTEIYSIEESAQIILNHIKENNLLAN